MLRKCTECGLEATTQEQLILFINNKPSKHGKQNLCIDCKNKRSAEYEKNNKEIRAIQKKKWHLENKDKNKKAYKKYYAKNKSGYNFRTSLYRANKLLATPKWADMEIIKDFYLEAKYHGLEVDHIVPLNNKHVCGLHVEHNLQLLSVEENRSKGNHYAC